VKYHLVCTNNIFQQLTRFREHQRKQAAQSAKERSCADAAAARSHKYTMHLQKRCIFCLALRLEGRLHINSKNASDFLLHLVLLTKGKVLIHIYVNERTFIPARRAPVKTQRTAANKGAVKTELLLTAGLILIQHF